MSVEARSARTSLQVTLSVWYALFIRDALARTMGDRLAWFWMIAEPVAFLMLMVGVRAITVAGQHVGGVQFIPWFIVGMMGFLLFRDNYSNSLNIINSNKGLFAYRQVKPIDTVLVRCYLESILRSFVMLLFIVLSLLTDYELLPDQPLLALFYWLSLWALGMSLGLVLSVASTLVSEIARIVRILALPAMISSGAMFPVSYLPNDILNILLLNPVIHGVESLRYGFYSNYHLIPGIDIVYLWVWVLALTFLGLILHLRFDNRLKSS